MPLQQTSGNVTSDAYGGGTAVTPVYIEEIFSTFLYTGNSSTNNIVNNIDLAGKGGMVWIKSRTSAASHALWDTARTPYYYLVSNATSAEQSVSSSNALTAYNADGFTVTGGSNAWNGSQNYASWTFRKQPKFFDVVTWTGNGVAGRQISHSLGSVPACIIVKGMETTNNWPVYHQSLGNTKHLNLNTTDSQLTSDTWNNTSPTATEFTIGSLNSVNQNGYQFVAYLFAHNAGGFGLTGTDNVISCGSFTTDANGFGSVTLGYEPQWVLIKNTTNAETWFLEDTMRSMTAGPTASALSAPNTSTYWLKPNLSDAEVTNLPAYGAKLQATGFTQFGGGGTTVNSTYIYIAIRRGPMKVPTSGTSVFSPVLRNGTGANANIQSGFPTDLIVFLNTNREWDAMGNYWTDRMRSGLKYLTSTATNAEGNWNNVFQNNNGFDTQNGVLVTSDVANGVINHSGTPYINWFFRRAPSFFDEVCYTGTGSNLTVSHNLGAVPEIIIIKRRSSAASNNNWYTGWNMNGPTYMESLLNTSDAGTLYTYPNWFTSTPTTTTFAIAGGGNVNANTATYVAYLFATCAGVSKVGTYTGNGTTQTINCGFTGGARFVLIKRTDSTGDWYVYDTARGMTTLTDPYLLLNSTSAESATLGSVTTVSTGFAVNASILAAINTNGASYIFLAIA